MTAREADYLRALRFGWLTRFYDPLIRLGLREDTFKRLLLEQVPVDGTGRVLDLGCGTGTLTIMLKRQLPHALVVGLDADAEVLSIAAKKAAQAGVDIEFRQGLAFEPLFPPGSFDGVVSSLFFHHLTTADKRRTLRAVHDLLRPGGTLHVADWGRPHTALMRLAFMAVRMLDGFERTADSAYGRLPALMKEAGLAPATETGRVVTCLGTLSLSRATKPPASVA